MTAIEKPIALIIGAGDHLARRSLDGLRLKAITLLLLDAGVILMPW